MADQDDVRRIALRLPGAVEAPEGFAFEVMNKGKLRGFVWVWRERIHPKKTRVPNADVLAVAVQSLSAKEVLLSSDEDKFFTEPHYNGFPAIMVRLPAIGLEELEDLIIEAWRCKAPHSSVDEFDQSNERRQTD